MLNLIRLHSLGIGICSQSWYVPFSTVNTNLSLKSNWQNKILTKRMTNSSNGSGPSLPSLLCPLSHSSPDAKAPVLVQTHPYTRIWAESTTLGDASRGKFLYFQNFHVGGREAERCVCDYVVFLGFESAIFPVDRKRLDGKWIVP